MATSLEKMILQSRTYNLLRYSALPDFFIEKLSGTTGKAKNYYGSFLTRHDNKLVFDVGANKGNKVKALLALGYRVIAVEPEKNSLKTLHYRFDKHSAVTLVEKGLSDAPGTAQIHIAAPRSGFNTLSNKWVDILGRSDVNRFEQKIEYADAYDIPLTTLDQLISEFGIPYFIKIDVEGYEVNVLHGLHAAPDFISFETNLPEFLEETLECIRHLQSISPDIFFNYSINDHLEFKQWISPAALIELMANGGMRYMEIIASLKGGHKTL